MLQAHCFLQHSDFDTILTVNVTTLLVLTTLFISISDALPRTSYVKMVDIWLIMSLLIPFLEIILQTFLNMLYNEEDTQERNEVTRLHFLRNYDAGTQKRKVIKATVKILKLTAQLVLPGFYILFCIIFFIVGYFQK